MSGMQGWPGAGPAPGPGAGPGQGNGDGRRFGILVLVVAAVVALSFGIATATGADSRDGGSTAAPPGLSGGGDLGGLEGSDLGASGGGDLGGGDLGGGDLGGGDLGGGGDSGTSSTGSSGGYDSGGSSGDSGATATPTAPPDPTLEAYQQVSSGDCLHNWMTGETTWASEVPETIGCGAEGAALWVSQTSDSISTCPVDSGRSYLSYTSGAETVAICVTRQFAVGQCFLGLPDGGANLMSWVDCEGNSVPAPYSQKYNVTGVYSAPANITGSECSRTSGDTTQYYWWTLDAETVMLCAVVYN
jgi:hypothetical protein